MRKPKPPISPAETNILRHVVAGQTYREIAAELGLSERTVRAHMSHVIGKLGVANRTQAALWLLNQASPEQKRLEARP